jgi:hypothetical protein
MPFYRFSIHGEDASCPPGLRGFYTTRHLWAADCETARTKLLQLLEHEFVVGESAHIWQSGPPVLTVEKSWRIGLHQLFAAPNRGSVFYDERETVEPGSPPRPLSSP